MKNFSIYRASAGSGKTYALTYNYLRLALKYPDNFKQILAVTFTNKATEEMKTRIISTLKEIGNGEHSMSEDLKKDLGIGQVLLSKKAEDLLVNILHNYSSFAVSTIDTFFQKIVRSFAREMGVQTGFKIELDQNHVIEEVIDQLLKNIADDPMLVGWLTEFALSKLSEGKSWETKGEINQLARELFKESIIADKQQLFTAMADPEFMPSYLKSIYSKKKEIETKYQSYGEMALNLMAEKGIAFEDFSYGKAGVGGYLFKVSKGEFISPGKRVLDAYEQGKWYSKSCKVAGQIDIVIERGLGEITEEMVNFYRLEQRLYNSLSAISKNIFAFGLLSRVSHGIDQYREENELLLISDFPLFLNQIINDSDSPYIYEKTGSRFKHYLIDEFQDTSFLQWQNFKPLVFDSVSQEQFNMVVGDVKQSIYRWRGGDWKILLEQVQKDIGEAFVQNESLSTNRRSKENIVKFNNTLYNQAPKELEYQLTDKVGGKEDVLKLKSAYTGVEQDLYDESGEGIISMCFTDKSSDTVDLGEVLLDRMVDEIKGLRKRNYELGDITILVRKKSEGKKVADRLIELIKEEGEGKYDFVSNETLLLKNNSAVNIIIQALRFAAEVPNDLNKAKLEYALFHHNESDENFLQIYLDTVESHQPKLLTDYVKLIITVFDLLTRKSDVPFVMGFQDAVLDYLSYEPDSLLEFLKWWDLNDRRSIQLSEGQNAINIMTIHKSKGLQFKAVLIPFCDWSLDYVSSMQPLLWCSTNELKGLSGVSKLPVRYGSALENTIFNEEYYKEKNDAYLDNLNLLYVATTRAEEYLYLGGKTSGRMVNMADLVLKISDEDTFEYEEPLWSKVIGELRYSEYSEKEITGVTVDPRPSDSLFKHDIEVRPSQPVLQESQQASIDHGDVVHWVLSQIETQSDFTNALDSAVNRFSLSDKELIEIKELLRKTWNLPGVSSWYDGSMIVKNEASILLDNGRLKRPDRVLIDGNKAVVIDYKTGLKLSKHLSQVDDYKRILSGMGYEEVKGYLLYLSTFEVLEV
ncbi:UvrD-helicase domain-containing protein [Reichenbachiella versicolor]|uniref:UvrD-helicase domain-containing protein n=1 Tax=Reichenbachiella versicolor TaxID=1821036 RepID=UPI000D6E199D|nr:UvrD-helicase domain-containing protein [Reichenbachiella versicolor]